jgi:integrase
MPAQPRLHAVPEVPPAVELRRAAVARWGRRLTAEGAAPRTVAIYTTAAAMLEDWLEAKRITVPFEEIDAETIDDFLHDFRHGSDLVKVPHYGELAPLPAHSPAYTNQTYRALRRFFARIAEMHGTADPMLRVVKPRAGRPNVSGKVLTDAQLEAVLATVAGKRDFRSRRDYAILRLFLIGPRRGEVAGLAVADLDLDNRTVRLSGKGDAQGERHRLVSFGRKTLLALDDYLMMRERHPLSWRDELWLGKRGPITGNGIYQIIRKRALQAGLRIHPHQFRHTFADQWLDDDGGEGHLMAHMGWESRQMVDLYAAETRAKRAREESRRRALDDRF